MSQYTIELLNRPFLPVGGLGFTFTSYEVAQFADKGEAVRRAKELHKSNEDRALGWRVLDSTRTILGIGLGCA